MTEQPAGLSCVRVYNLVEPHHGCCYVSSVTALHPQADSEWLRKTPMPPCRQGAHTGLFILIPLSNGAAMKADVCDAHAELIENLYRESVTGEGAP